MAKYIIEIEDVPSMLEDGFAFYKCVDAPWWYISDMHINRLKPYVDPKRNSGWWVHRDHNKQIANGVYTAMYTFPICSECGWSGRIEYAFCPHCGARMRGKPNETD